MVEKALNHPAASTDVGAAARAGATSMANIGLMFDCDGVLLDSMGAWKAAEMAVCATVGKTPTKEDIDYVNTLTINEAGVFFHERYGVGESPDDVVRLIDQNMLGYYQKQAQPCAGALEFAREMRAWGARMVVVSSSPLRYLEAGLQSTGFAQLMDAIFSADEMRTSKRERMIFDAAHKVLGTDASLTWGFDDTAYALVTMANVGFKTVGIYSGDESSTVKQLADAADYAFERGFEELTADCFLRLVQ